MPRSRLPRLSSIKDGSFEPSKRNPISLRKDENLDKELKPLEIGGKTTTLELSNDSAKFSGDLFVDRIKGGIAQTGGDFITSGEQIIRVGDNPGGRERVQITPLSSPNLEGPQGQGINISISGNVMSENYTEDVIIPQIRDALSRGEDLGIS